MRVHTNVSSLKAQRALGEHTKDIESSQGKLSSGLRVRTSADDAASFAIGSKLSAKTRTLKQAERNANDVISELQIVEGSMDKMSSILLRLREISLNAATDTLGDSEREMLNYEYMGLRNEIERLANSASINKNAITTVGDITGSKSFQIGASSEENAVVTIEADKITLNQFNLHLVDSHVRTREDARINLGHLDFAIQKLSGTRAYVGSIQSRMHIAANNLNDSATTATTSRSRFVDADYAEEAAANVAANFKQKSATGVLAQANNLGANALKLLQNS